jgi:hypothetical protein
VGKGSRTSGGALQSHKRLLGDSGQVQKVRILRIEMGRGVSTTGGLPSGNKQFAV